MKRISKYFFVIVLVTLPVATSCSHTVSNETVADIIEKYELKRHFVKE